MDLKARKYNTRIKLYDTVSTPDGFGGNTTTFAEVAQVFARRSNYKVNPYFTEGLKLDQERALFQIRRYDLTSSMFVVYDGLKYDIEHIDRTQLQGQMILRCVNTGFEIIEVFDETFDETFN